MHPDAIDRVLRASMRRLSGLTADTPPTRCEPPVLLPHRRTAALWKTYSVLQDTGSPAPPSSTTGADTTRRNQ
jgi:hypothetical protein